MKTNNILKGIAAMMLCLAAGQEGATAQNISRRSLDAIPAFTQSQYGRMPYSATTATAARAAKAEDNMQVVVSEDFSLFKAGSEEAPDMTNILTSEGYIMYDYVQTYGWLGIKVFQAGGCAYLADGTTALLATPILNLSGSEGNFTIKVSYRTKSNGKFIVIWGNGSAPIGSSQGEASTDKWNTLEIKAEGGMEETMIQFYGDGTEVFIDDISIEQESVAPPTISKPEGLSATDITGTSFTANWSSVVGAEKYLVSVYYHEDNQRCYIEENKEVETTSCHIDGLPEDKICFFNVKATNENATSVESMEAVVKEASEDVGTPEALPATEITEDGFRANWTEAENAILYSLYTYSIYTVPETGDYVIEDENFNKITSGTPENPEYNIQSGTLNDYTIYPNWEGLTTVLAEGMIGLKNYYAVAGVYSTLYTPIYVIESAGTPGTVTVTIDAKQVNCSSNTEIGVCLVDAETEEQTEWEKRTFSSDEETFEFTFDTGFETYYAAISFADNNDRYGTTAVVFIDNVKVTQQLAQGDRLSKMYSADTAYNTTFYRSITDKPAGEQFIYFVGAVTNGAEEYLYSDISNEVMVDYSAVEKTAHTGCRIYSCGDMLRIEAENETPVEITDLTGAVRESFTAPAGCTDVQLERGVYIVKAGNTTAKAVIR